MFSLPVLPLLQFRVTITPAILVFMLLNIIPELIFQLRDSGAKLLLTGVDAASNALEAAKLVGIPTSKVFTFCDPWDCNKPQPHGLEPWTSFWAPAPSVKNWSWKRITTLEEAQSTTAIINYSSGTTGLPKGVEISHYNLISNAEQVLHKKRLVANTPEAKLRTNRLDLSGDRWLAPIPMYHAYVWSRC